jgi:hypothetical protein
MFISVLLKARREPMLRSFLDPSAADAIAVDVVQSIFVVMLRPGANRVAFHSEGNVAKYLGYLFAGVPADNIKRRGVAVDF